MSEKKDNKDLFQNSAQRRKAKENQEKKASKKTKLTAIIIALAIVLLFAGAMLINSNFLRRTATAATVGGEKFSATEFDYFYFSSYLDYVNSVYSQYPEYAESLLPSSQAPLNSQVYDAETGETWADYFRNAALQKMQDTVKLRTAAEDANFTLSAEDSQRLDADILELIDNSLLNGYSSFEKYLASMYGSTMTEKVFKNIMTGLYTSNAYAISKNDSFTYTEEELDAYYDEHKDLLDVFSYRYFLVTSETPETAEDATDEEIEAAKADALAEAGVRANEMKARIEKSADAEVAFIEEANSYNPDSYSSPDSTLRNYKGELLGSVYGDWLRDTARKEGDVFTTDISTGYYVVYYGSRSDNDYPTVAMRQILITPGTVNLSEYGDDAEDNAYKEALALVNNMAKSEAEQVLAELRADSGTEEKFLELIQSYSDDTTEGGFYENIYKWQMVPEIDAWLFDPARVEGDYATVKSEAYGYHILFFKGTGSAYKDYLAENEKRGKDYTAWYEALPIPETKTNWAFRLTTA